MQLSNIVIESISSISTLLDNFVPHLYLKTHKQLTISTILLSALESKATLALSPKPQYPAVSL